MPRIAPSISPLLLPMLLVGCAPNDAEIKGDWLVWFSSNSSSVVENEDIVDLDDRATIYSCQEFVDCTVAHYDGLAEYDDNQGTTFFDDLQNFEQFRAAIENGEIAGGRGSIPANALRNCAAGGWDPIKQRYQNTYHGPQLVSQYGDSRHIGGACAYESEDDGTPIVDEETGDIQFISATCDDNAIEEIITECGPLADTRMRHGYHDWMTLDAFHAMRGSIEPWRTEAMINGEGDLQLTIHFKVDGEDVFFSWTIDPDFDPVECLSTANGGAEVIGVDGGDWVGNWSDDEDGYSIYYLNSGALQSSGSETWYLPVDWLSGFGHANFIGEEFYSEPGAYGNYYNPYFNFTLTDQSFLSVTDRNNPDAADQQGWADSLQEYATLWESEMVNAANAYAGSAGSPSWTFEHKVEDNLWRAPDDRPAGIDGWMEVHQSWVRVKDGAKIEKGGTAKGDFQIVFTGAETSSRMVVAGSFDITNIREDRWAYPVLEDELRNSDFGTKYCN